MSENVLTAAGAVEITSDLAAHGIRYWVMGGWGIDALLGAQTRKHHDLDLLVSTSDLPALNTWLRQSGFDRAYEWEENAPVEMDGATWDTAFVEVHPDGRELDVHGVTLRSSSILLATSDPWQLPPDPLGVGQIGGRVIQCVTADAQRAMHRGYEMPEDHCADLRKLDQL